MQKLKVMYSGSGAVQVYTPNGIFLAKMYKPRQHNITSDIEYNIKNAVKRALENGQHWKTLNGGFVRYVEFDDDTVNAMMQEAS